MSQADKTVQSVGSGFSLFGGKAEKYENAVELYTQAANAFRLQKAGKEAGQCFERAAAIQSNQLKEPDDAANTLTEAYKSYRKDEPREAARVLESAINHYTLKGNFRRAATHKQNLAELYEIELNDETKAMEAYELAASWFENDNAEASVTMSVLESLDITLMARQTREQALSQAGRHRRSTIRLLQGDIQL